MRILNQVGSLNCSYLVNRTTYTTRHCVCLCQGFDTIQPTSSIHTVILHTWQEVSRFTSSIWYWHRIHSYNDWKNYHGGEDKCHHDLPPKSLFFSQTDTDNRRNPRNWLLSYDYQTFSSYLSLSEPLADLLSSHGRRQPFSGDCSSKDDVDNCFCLEEIEDRQLKELLSLFFSLLL